MSDLDWHFRNIYSSSSGEEEDSDEEDFDTMVPRPKRYYIKFHDLTISPDKKSATFTMYPVSFWNVPLTTKRWTTVLRFNEISIRNHNFIEIFNDIAKDLHKQQIEEHAMLTYQSLVNFHELLGEDKQSYLGVGALNEIHTIRDKINNSKSPVYEHDVVYAYVNPDVGYHPLC